MKAFLVIFAAILVGSLATIATVSLSRSAPASPPVHEARSLAGFHAIDITGQATVTLVQGASEGVTVDAPASTRVRTEVREGTLVIEVSDRKGSWQWLSGRGPGAGARITVNLRELDRLEGAGAVSVLADKLEIGELYVDLAGVCTMKIGELEATTLKVDGSGATKMQIAGKVARQEIDLSGAGSYDGGQLASDEASVDVSGAGKAVVNARKSLSVDISGAGKVEYFGDPALKQTISGIGKVSRRQAPGA
jgi:hypothetical protein